MEAGGQEEDEWDMAGTLVRGAQLNFGGVTIANLSQFGAGAPKG